MKISALFVAIAFAAAMFAGAASAERRVYAGPEAAALKCAHMISLVPIALEQQGLLSTSDREVMVTYAYLMLDRHVSGTWDQKMQAIRQMGDRYPLLRTLEAFSREADACRRQFPI